MRPRVRAETPGVFEALRDGPMTAAELSDRLGTDHSGTGILLKALNGARYLTRRNGRYSNGRVVRRWLVDGALVHLKDSLLFYGDLWEARAAYSTWAEDTDSTQPDSCGDTLVSRRKCWTCLKRARSAGRSSRRRA